MVSEKPPDKDDAETWKRVIAVVLIGKPWQFKQFPFAVSVSMSLIQFIVSYTRAAIEAKCMTCCIIM